MERATALGSWLQFPRLQPGWTPRSVRIELRTLLLRTRAGTRRECKLQLEGRARRVRSARAAYWKTFAVPQQWRRHVHGREPEGRDRERNRVLRNDGGRRGS